MGPDAPFDRLIRRFSLDQPQLSGSFPGGSASTGQAHSALPSPMRWGRSLAHFPFSLHRLGLFKGRSRRLLDLNAAQSGG